MSSIKKQHWAGIRELIKKNTQPPTITIPSSRHSKLMKLIRQDALGNGEPITGEFIDGDTVGKSLDDLPAHPRVSWMAWDVAVPDPDPDQPLTGEADEHVEWVHGWVWIVTPYEKTPWAYPYDRNVPWDASDYEQQIVPEQDGEPNGKH